MNDEFDRVGSGYGVIDPSNLSDKNWIIAAVLNLFFGWAGIHRFYLGRPLSGIVMLLLTVIGWLTAGIIIGIVVIAFVAIWNFVDFIRIICNGLTDGRGRKLR